MALPMPQRQQTLVIALEGAHSSLLRRLAGTGAMPTMAKCMEDGAWGPLHNEFAFSTAAWDSLYTGMSAARHGRYAFDQLIPGTYRARIVAGAHPRQSPFWEILSRAGSRVIVINAPNTGPSKNLNGLQLARWLTHAVGHYAPCQSWPPSLAAEVAKRYPPDAMHFNDWGHVPGRHIHRVLAGVRANLAHKADLVERLIRAEEWNLFFVTFDEIHTVAHSYWHLHDETHPQHDTTLRGTFGDPVAETYAAIDTALSRISAAMPRDATLLVVALGGIAVDNSWSHLLDVMLHQLEGRGAQPTPSYYRLRSFWSTMPHWLKPPLLGAKTRLRETYLARHRRRRTAFAFPLNEECGGIRINLRGREPNGIVEPGEAYTRLCDDLCRELLQLVDVETGRPLIKEIIRTHQRFRGEYLDELPDLVVEWDWSRSVHTVESPRLGRITRRYEGIHPGGHHRDGMLLATGPHVMPGSLTGVSVTDLAPTLTALHRIDTHPPFCGRPIQEVCDRTIAKDISLHPGRVGLTTDRPETDRPNLG